MNTVNDLPNKICKYSSMALNLALRKIRKNGKVIGLPAHLQVEITNACNLLCQSCHRDLLYPKTNTMSFDQFQKIFDNVRPVKINVSGLGEPFLNPDVFKIIKHAKKNGAAVNCATNFTLVADKIEAIFESGIDQLKVSIDASCRETFFRIRKYDLFNTLVGNIKKVNKIKNERGLKKPNIRFNYALQKDNIDELIPTIDLAHDLRVEALYVQYLAYVDREDRKSKLVGDMKKEKIRDVLTEAEISARRYGISTNINMWMREFDFFWNNMQPGQYFSPDNKPCYFPWFSSWIDADGTVRPCPVIPWRKGIAHMGNALEKPFSRIWNNDVYRNFRRIHADGKRPVDVCKTCIPQSIATIFQIGTKLLPK